MRLLKCKWRTTRLISAWENSTLFWQKGIIIALVEANNVINGVWSNHAWYVHWEIESLLFVMTASWNASWIRGKGGDSN